MKILANVFFEMRASDADARDTALKFKIDVAVYCGWLVILCDLIILRRVRIEIILAVELRVLGHSAVEEQPSQGGEAQSFIVRHRQHAGHAKADWADVGVRRRAEFVGATAPHLRSRF